MLTADEILTKVNEYIDNLSYDRQPDSLYAPIKYVLSMGGKRIRPVLMLLAYNLYRDDAETILLMDRAELRRGHQTVHKRWNDNTAILSGDTMLVLAYQRIAQCNPTKLKLVLDLFTETALEIGEGQQYDMDFENRNDVTEDEYIEMIRLKTSVLLACALKTGAILAGAPQKDADTLYKFGEQIGLAFQLQDDFLDVYGDTQVFGKAIGGDIVSNKKTYMLINALNRATEKQRAELEQWLSAPHFDAKEKIAAVTLLYNEIGVDLLATAKISYFYDQSRKYLAALNIPEMRKCELIDYTSRMMNRQY